MVLVSGGFLSMKVTEAQANDMEFLSGALDNLANFTMVLQHCHAKAEGPVMSKWDEAVQVRREDEVMEMSSGMQVLEPEELLAPEQLVSEEEFQGFLLLSSSC